MNSVTAEYRTLVKTVLPVMAVRSRLTVMRLMLGYVRVCSLLLGYEAYARLTAETVHCGLEQTRIET